VFFFFFFLKFEIQPQKKVMFQHLLSILLITIRHLQSTNTTIT